MQRRGRGVEAQKDPVFIGVIDRTVQRLIVHLPLQTLNRFSRLHSSSFHLSAVGCFLGCNVLEGGGENRTSSQRNHFTPIMVSHQHANREMDRLFLGALLLYYYYRYLFFFLGSFKSESVHVRVNKEFASLIFAHVYADTFLISSNATEWSVPTMVHLFLPIFLSLMYEEHRWKYYWVSFSSYIS